MASSVRPVSPSVGRARYWASHEAPRELLDRCRRVHQQVRHDGHKLYSLHAPEVVCISKGKARQRYEFGAKVGVVTSLKKGWVLTCQSFEGNPHDGHTLTVNLANAVCRTGVPVKLAAVDKGYRKHDAHLLGIDVLIPEQRPKGRKTLSHSLRKKLRRRNAIEPVIGHLKHDHRMGRSYLKGRLGDQLNAIGAALGFNFRKLLKGLKADAACAAFVMGMRVWIERWIASHRTQLNTIAA